MARTYRQSGSLIIVEGDPFDEGRDDFLEFDLVDEDGEPITTVSAITATLRTKPYTGLGAVINSRQGQDVNGANGGLLTAGTFRLALGGLTDLVAVGGLDMQARELTLMVTHSSPAKTLPLIVRFLVRPHADVPVPTPP